MEKGWSVEQLFGSRHYLLVEGIAHWGLDLVDPDEEYSAADFKRYAEKKIEEILDRGHVPFLAGGTGFWLKALMDNLDLGAVPSQTSARVRMESRSVDDLFAEYALLDPAGAQKIDSKNKRRLMRALEVVQTTGDSFYHQPVRDARYDVLQLGLRVPREVLYERIDDRVDEMVARGLVDEVCFLKERYGCMAVAMSGIGYRQICRFFDKEISLATAVEEIKKDTRHYAKRQMTWFKRDGRIQWVETPEKAMKEVEQFLSGF